MKEEQFIDVGISDMKIAKAPDKLITRGLGSCVGITLYDQLKKTGGMAHAMLPDVEKAALNVNPLRFVNYVIRHMARELEKSGSNRQNIEAKLFGGAHMFAFISSDSILNVSDKNVEMARSVLKELCIEIIADETGGTFGRTITLDLETGKVNIKTVAWGEKEV